MTIVPIRGLFESHLTVSDIDRSIGFYRDVLGLELAHRIAERHCAFFWMGAPGQTMLGLWSIHSSPVHSRLHIAFAVALDDVIASVGRLRAAGITPRSGGGGAAIEEPIRAFVDAGGERIFRRPRWPLAGVHRNAAGAAAAGAWECFAVGLAQACLTHR